MTVKCTGCLRTFEVNRVDKWGHLLVNGGFNPCTTYFLCTVCTEKVRVLLNDIRRGTDFEEDSE